MAMPKIVIGMYYGADSPVHRADPRYKIICSFLFLVMVFTVPGFWGMVAMTVVTFTIVGLTRIPIRTVFRSILPLLFILIFAVLLNLLFTKEGLVYWHWGIFTVTDIGVYRSIFYPYRIFLLLLGMSVLTLTTTPIDITDATERLSNPLKRVGFPAHEFAMMLGIALRFLPVFSDEFIKIKRAQESRGADFSGGLFRKAKALSPLIVPLFVSAFRHAENLATAMEARCYHGGEGRTRMNVLCATRSDHVMLACFLVALAGAIVMRVLV